jgi:hypothetical protein
MADEEACPMTAAVLPAVYHCSGEPYRAEVIHGTGVERETVEKTLLDAGLRLPIAHRSAWARARAPMPSWFLAVRDGRGRPCGGFAIEVDRSRALPGHRILRVQRFGTAAADAVRQVGLRALVDLSRRQPLVLRVELEVFSRDADVRRSVAAEAGALGFRRREHRRAYGRTVVVDLDRDERDVLASFSATARQNIRAVQKAGWHVRCITEDRWGEAIAGLLREAFRRTGGEPPPWDWTRVIHLSRSEPGLSRLAGLFGVENGGGETLWAFAWGRWQGDHVEYSEAGSARAPGVRTPLAHALAWDLMCWARGNGAAWFDFGGITERRPDQPDALAGISHFKRLFSKTEADVREEWVLEPHPLRSRIGDAVSTTAGWLTAATRAARRRLDGSA